MALTRMCKRKDPGRPEGPRVMCMHKDSLTAAYGARRRVIRMAAISFIAEASYRQKWASQTVEISYPAGRPLAPVVIDARLFQGGADLLDVLEIACLEDAADID